MRILFSLSFKQFWTDRLVCCLGHRILCAQDMFEAIDRDGSGEIDIEEFEKGIRRLGLGLTPGQLEWLLGTMDADGNGEIDEAEFIARLPC